VVRRAAASDHAQRFVLPVALHHRIDAEQVGIRWQGTWARSEDDAAAGHVVELDDALCHVEGVVIRQRHHAGAEPDAMRALAGCGEEELGRGDDLPPCGVVLAAPELVVAELVEVLGRSRSRDCASGL
jgi:hypothetical protein